MIRLALAYLRDRPLMTALNVLLLALAVATLVILLSVSTQLGARFERDARGVDLVVGAKGSPLQLILSTIYHVDVPTGNIPLESIAMLRADPAVRQVIPLALGDNFRGYRIVGTESAYLEQFQATVAQGTMFAKPREVVVGASVAKTLGIKVGQRFIGAHGLSADENAGEHEHAPFTTVGILAPTGSVIDRLILTPVESVWDAHGIAHGEDADELHDHHPHEPEKHSSNLAQQEELQPEVTALLVSYKSAFGAVRIPSMINRQTNMQAAVPAIETARLLTLLGLGIDGARAFAWLLAATGGLSIFVALLAAATSREADLALLRVMGASPWQVCCAVLAEGFIIAAIGAVAGLLLGHAALAIAAQSFAQLGEFGFDPFAFMPGEGAIALSTILIGLVAAFIPALRIFRTDLARSLAQAN